MTADPDGQNTREEQLHELLAGYYEVAERGERVDRRDLLDRHPDFAADLADFFSVQDQLHRLAEPLRPQEPGGANGQNGTDRIDPDPLATIVAELASLPPAPEGDHDLRDYDVLDEIARGGMGVVYRARQRSLNRLVALKVIRDGVSATEDDARRFRNEAEAVANLDHPHIVPIYEVGDHRGCRFFSMKLVEGGNLAERLAEFSAQPRDAARLMVTVARAVHHAHERGILHRDLKPSNILIDGQGHPLVADFGLARRVEADSELTQTGAVLGTPSYMAPEQATGRKGAVTTATDVHGLGAVLYALLTGKPPFRGDSPLETLERVREHVPEPPSAVRTGTDRDLETICLKCLEKDPRQRYASAEAVAEDLERWLAGRSILARPAGRAERAWRWCRRHPLPTALLLFTAVLASLIVAGLVLGARARQTIHTLNDGLLTSERVLSRHYYAVDLSQAFHLIRTNQVAEAVELLSRHRHQPGRADTRGFEWYFLWRLSHVGRPALAGHQGEVYHAVFSRDGQSLASCSGDRTVRLWDVPTGHERLVIAGHSDDINWVSFSPDGLSLATASDDQTVRLWDVDRGAPKLTLTGHNDRVVAVVFAPDGKRLISCGRNGKVIVWDPATSERRESFDVSNGTIQSLAISPDGATLAIAGEKVVLWNLAVRKEARRIGEDHEQINGVVFSHDGKALVTGGNRNVRLWDVGTGRNLAAFQGHGASVEGVSISPDDQTVASVDDHGTIYFWDVATGAAGQIASRQGRLWCAEFSPDGQTLATSSADGSVRLWDSLLDRDRISIRMPSQKVPTISFSADGKNLLATAGEAGSLWTWDAARGIPLPTRRFATEETKGNHMLSRDGSVLATVDSKGRVRHWQVQDGRCVSSLPLDGIAISILEIAPRGNAFATADAARTVSCWAQGRVLARTNYTLNCETFSPDGHSLAFAQRGSAGPSLWDLTIDAIRTQGAPGHQGEVYAMEFFPDGRSLATGGNDKAIKIWDVATLEARLNLVGHTGAVLALAIAPQGGTIASAAYDSTLKLWRDGLPQAILTIDDHNGLIERIRFSPDGSTLATCAKLSAKEYQVFLWPSAPRDGEAAPQSPENSPHRR